MDEIWKDIKGYEGLYQISNKGQVKSKARRGNWKETILKPSETRDHYFVVTLSKNGVQKSRRVNRIVAETFIDNPKIIRPANYSKGVPGKGYNIFNCNNKKIAVINLIGRTDMNILSENPFTVVEQIVNKIKNDVDIIIVDFHAEATAEKIAMKHFLDGRVNIIYGTHTHVQTADEEITEDGTAYITDLGMTGPKNSVIGMDVKASIKRFVTSLPERYKLAEGNAILNGCIFDINDENCKTVNIKRINYR